MNEWNINTIQLHRGWFFTRNTPKMFAPPSAIGKNKIFWRKIVIFHTKYPKHFRASLRSVQFFKCAPPPKLEILDPPWSFLLFTDIFVGIVLAEFFFYYVVKYFSYISWRSVLLVETGVPGENHRPDASHW